MDISLEQKQRVKKVIKYDVSRRYFGDWAPRDLYNCYSTLYRNCEMESIKLRVGNLSVDDICNALWTEMSYNPVRFGTISPFKFDGRNSLQDFCNMEIDKDLKSAKTLLKLQVGLKEFYRIASDKDKNFAHTNRFNNQVVEIKIYDYSKTQNPDLVRQNAKKPAPNSGYKMLTELIHCMRAITSQNLADLNRKTYFEPMFEVALTRHQNLVRGTKYVSFVPYQINANAKTDTPKNLKLQLNKYLRQQSKLERTISKRIEYICVIQARIDNLNDLENPGDTRIEQAHLNKESKIVEKLEEKLSDIKRKIADIQNTQCVM